MLNFKTVIVSDATTARSDAEHNAALSSLLNLFADVMTTQEVIERTEASAGKAAQSNERDPQASQLKVITVAAQSSQ